MGLQGSFAGVALAFFCVLVFDPVFRADVIENLTAYASDGNKWFHVLLGSLAIYSIYNKIQRNAAAARKAGGVGLRLRCNKKLGWVIVEVVAGGSGEEGGVQAGDIITAVDGASVHGFTTVSVIRGPVGSDVTLRIVRGIKDVEKEIEADKEEQRRIAAGEPKVKEEDAQEQGQAIDFANTGEYAGLETLELKLVRKGMSGKKPAPKQVVLSKPVFEPPPSSAVQAGTIARGDR